MLRVLTRSIAALVPVSLLFLLVAAFVQVSDQYQHRIVGFGDDLLAIGKRQVNICSATQLHTK